MKEENNAKQIAIQKLREHLMYAPYRSFIINKVLIYLRIAQIEISCMVDLLAMLEAGKHLQIVPSVRTPVAPKVELDHIIYQTITKQKVSKFLHKNSSLCLDIPIYVLIFSN